VPFIIISTLSLHFFIKINTIQREAFADWHVQLTNSAHNLVVRHVQHHHNQIGERLNKSLTQQSQSSGYLFRTVFIGTVNCGSVAKTL
jgi:hypothetical protein